MKNFFLLFFPMALLMLICCTGNGVNTFAANTSTSQPAIVINDSIEIEKDLAEINSQFTYKGKYINPKIIYEFIPWLSDGMPIIMSIDLAGATQSNQFSIDDTSAIGATRYQTANGNGTYSSFSYKYIGKLDNNIHVLETFDSGGGSGVFEGLLFLSFKKGKIVEWNGERKKNTEQILITKEGYHGLCDRCETKFTIKGNKLLIDFVRINGEKEHSEISFD